jgi:hypothetical protein
MDKPGLRLSVRDLIERGAFKAPLKAYGGHNGVAVEATIQTDGTFLWQGQTFNSPSVAAGYAVTALTKTTTPGRSYLSINGWKFWSVECADGHSRTLSEIRELLEPSGPAA